MALKRNETYPGRFSNPTSDHPQGAFKNRSAPGAQDGSFCEQQWANDWDGFFGRLLTVAGITPDGNVDTASTSQYYDALKSLFLQRVNPFGDIKSDGSVATALANLGLGEGSTLPVGVPVPWPSATPPTGWLKCNGADFSTEEYPELAKAYPTNKLPDLRGEFIRGWDDGRGVDSGRSLLSGQDATFIRTALQDYYGLDIATTVKVGIAFASADKVQTSGIPDNAKASDSSDYVPASHDNSITGTQRTSEGGFYSTWISVRPRNTSFNYIVRAA